MEDNFFVRLTNQILGKFAIIPLKASGFFFIFSKKKLIAENLYFVSNHWRKKSGYSDEDFDDSEDDSENLYMKDKLEVKKSFVPAKTMQDQKNTNQLSVSETSNAKNVDVSNFSTNSSINVDSGVKTKSSSSVDPSLVKRNSEGEKNKTLPLPHNTELTNHDQERKKRKRYSHQELNQEHIKANQIRPPKSSENFSNINITTINSERINISTANSELVKTHSGGINSSKLRDKLISADLKRVIHTKENILTSILSLPADKESDGMHQTQKKHETKKIKGLSTNLALDNGAGEQKKQLIPRNREWDKNIQRPSETVTHLYDEKQHKKQRKKSDKSLLEQESNIFPVSRYDQQTKELFRKCLTISSESVKSKSEKISRQNIIEVNIGRLRIRALKPKMVSRPKNKVYSMGGLGGRLSTPKPSILSLHEYLSQRSGNNYE